MDAFKINGKPVNVDYHKDPANKIWNSKDLTIDMIDKEWEY